MAVSQLPWSDKDREEWFFFGENHEKARAFPNFLPRCTRQGTCAPFRKERRMKFAEATETHRKSGFGPHQLRNRFNLVVQDSEELLRIAAAPGNGA